MPRIGNRTYPPVLSDQQRGVVRDLLNDPGWEKLTRPQTQIGNRTYADDTVGQAAPAAPPSKIMGDLHQYAAGLGKTANDLTLPELNQFIGQYGGSTPPTTMYRLPSNY
jgi:hypothetical protein